MTLVALKPRVAPWPRPELSKTALRHDFFARAEKKIRDAGLTPRRVCERAGFSYRAFQRCAAGQRIMSRASAGRISRAVDAILAGLADETAGPTERECLVAYRAFNAEWRRGEGLPSEDAGETRGPAAEARHVAWYLVSTELGAAQALVASLAGVTRAAVHQWFERIEDRREDPGFEARVEKTAARIMGRT